MYSTAFSITIAIIAFLLIIGCMFGMLLLLLKYGPKSGFFNQPAAKLKPVTRGTAGGMYMIAALHILAGVVMLIFVKGAGFAMLALMILMAAFYVLMAKSYALMMRLGRVNQEGS